MPRDRAAEVGTYYEPKDQEDQANSVLLSDHYLSSEDLRSASERIKTGQGVTFDEAYVQELVDGIRVVEKEELLGMHKRRASLCVVVMLGLVLMAVGYLFGRWAAQIRPLSLAAPRPLRPAEC